MKDELYGVPVGWARELFVVITGAASGIGRATALMFAAAGAQVLGIDLRFVEALPDGSQQRFEELVADVSTVSGREVIAETVATRGVPTTLVHAAGVSRPGSTTSTSDPDWDDVIRVNVTAVMGLNRSLVPMMASSRNNSVVIVASQLGLVGTRNSLAYSASKGAAVNLMRSSALELAPAGVRVNCVCPGPTDTPFLQRSFERSADPDGSRSEARSRVPLGRFARPDEIASVIMFVASPGASFMTGAVVPVDGGYTTQ